MGSDKNAQLYLHQLRQFISRGLTLRSVTKSQNKITFSHFIDF